MSSQVLARKYRPRTLDEVVGQETTVRILRNALDQKRIHHAYLFAGPRGTGKTSLARIFARALNCEKGPTAKPCGTCAPCQEILEGRSLSVIEIDGASNNLVEDVRDLREKINYISAGGRYKVYIIDEVHMLSKPAFNALLKTLEEPPPHAVFVFATTEPDKVLATVLSRVIRFDLRPIPAVQIVGQLKKVAQEEKVSVDEKALFLIGREARGGMRDALSLLDQAIAFASGQVTESSIEEVIGVSSRRFIFSILEAVTSRNGAAVLKAAQEAMVAGVETKRLAADLLEYFRHLLVAGVSQDPALFDLPEEEIQTLATLAQAESSANLDALFQILQRSVLEILRSPTPKVLLDVLLLRLSQFDRLRSLDLLLEQLGQPSAAVPQSAERPAARPSPQPVAAKPAQSTGGSKTWPDFLNALKSKKPHIASMLQEGALAQLGEKEAVVRFPAGSIHLTLLKEPDREGGLNTHMTDFFGRPLVLRLEASQESAASSNKIVEDAMSILGAKTVAPRRNS